jgi:hypothetical protein
MPLNRMVWRKLIQSSLIPFIVSDKFGQFCFYCTEKHSSKIKQPKNKGRIALILLNKSVKHLLGLETEVLPLITF